MHTLFQLVFLCFISVTVPIYSIPVTSVDNTSAIDLSEYAGKKILIVNIATGSEYAGQLEQLQELYEEYGSTLAVIGFPSNSFGKEDRTNTGIQQVCSNLYQVSFPIASKAEVKGNNIQPVYNWLTKQSENGVMDSEVKGDFQKYLVNEQGELIGVFAGSMPPNHPAIIDAITDN